MGTSSKSKRTYTVSSAVVEQRTAAACQPRGGRRAWTNVRVSDAVMAALDKRRGDDSRNTYLEKLLGLAPSDGGASKPARR